MFYLESFLEVKLSVVGLCVEPLRVHPEKQIQESARWNLFFFSPMSVCTVLQEVLQEKIYSEQFLKGKTVL